MPTKKYAYDLLVLGAGPAGQKAALAAAKFNKKVAMVEPKFIGGICTHRGTVPSKTFREAAIHLTDYRLRFVEPLTRKKPTMQDLVKRVDWVIHNEVLTIEGQLKKNNVDIIAGYGFFKDNHHIYIKNVLGEVIQTISFDKAIIATGTKPHLRDDIEYDGESIFYTDIILTMKNLPRSMTIVGGGIIGCEYASIFSVLGVKVTVVERRDDILSLVDRELRANLTHQLESRKVQFCLNDSVTSCIKTSDGHVITQLDSGRVIKSEIAAFCTFRTVCSTAIGIDKLGIVIDSRGVIQVDKNFRTSKKNIYAAGDVIGHPALASTSFEQGRIAAHRAMGEDTADFSPALPIGIYTIPEISFIGQTESQLTEAKIPYCVGKAYYKDTSRGSIIGALDGMLKLVFHLDTRKLLSVHIIGEDATELLHVGQAVMELGGTVDYFMDHTFNYPTLAETYKYAAISGINRMQDR